jgi:hypothetical protein
VPGYEDDARPMISFIPADYEFLDPARPEIRYESDLSPEERKRMERQLEALRQRAAKARVQPPWAIRSPDGPTKTGGPSAEPRRAQRELAGLRRAARPTADAWRILRETLSDRLRPLARKTLGKPRANWRDAVTDSRAWSARF